MKKFFVLCLLLLCTIGVSFGQATLPAAEVITPDNIFTTLVEPLYGGIFIVLTYLSYMIPGLKNFSSSLVRAVTVGLVVGLGFIMFGVPFWKVAITYLLSSGLYAYFLKAFQKTPNPVAQLPGG